MPNTHQKSPKPFGAIVSKPKPEGNAESVLGSYKPDVLNLPEGYASTRHGLLKRVLYGMETKQGNPIYKTLQRCGDFTGREGTGITYVGTYDRRIYKTGVIRCKNPECPQCGPSIASKKINLLTKALSGIKLEGGSVALLTITMRPTKDPTKGIKAMMRLRQKLSKALRNNDRGQFDGHKGVAYTAIERTHSDKWAYKDEYGNKTSPFAYLHTHIHMAIGWTKRNPIDQLKRITLDFFNDAKNGVSNDMQVSGSEDGHRAIVSHGWDIEYVEEIDRISQYLNKVCDQSNQLSLELNHEGSKTGKGLGLFTLLKLLDNDRSNALYNAHKKNIRAWFSEMFGKSRVSMYNVDYWALQFKHHQKKIIQGWLDRKEIDLTNVEQAFSVVSMDWAGVEYFWEDDKLEPTHITDEIRHKDKIVFTENVDVRLYNSLRNQGYESTLEHLFKRYWFDGLNKTCYNEYRKVNLRFDPLEMTKLIDLLHIHGLLKGSRYNNY